MINVTIKISLVESLVEEGYTCKVLLLEIKEAMQDSIGAGLMNGQSVSLRSAFDEAWQELVVHEGPVDMEF